MITSSCARSRGRALILIAMFALVPCSAGAQSYPSKSIRLVVPVAPGGGVDFLAHLLRHTLTAALGQPVIVENRVGGAGRVGTASVAQSAPDGHTLLLGYSGAIMIAPGLYPKLAYDTLRDFSPISLLASAPYVLVVHPSVPARSVRELIILARSKPGRLNYASSGETGPPRLAAELMKLTAGIDMLHVPYKGSAPATMSVMSGETDLLFSNIIPAVPAIRAGRLRPLAVTSDRRSQQLRDIPTVAEAGLPGCEAETFYGLLAPARVPGEIVNRLNQELVKIVETPDNKNKLLSSGFEPLISTPAEYEKIIKSETAKWKKVIMAAGIKPED